MTEVEKDRLIPDLRAAQARAELLRAATNGLQDQLRRAQDRIAVVEKANEELNAELEAGSTSRATAQKELTGLRERLAELEATLRKILEADDPPLPPALEEETDAQYTDRLTGADGGTSPYPERRNRQCSIGFHGECSDPAGESCKCPCHKLNERFTEARTAIGAAKEKA